MSDCHDSRDRGLSPAEMVMTAILLTVMLVLAWVYIRWVIETREGKVFTAVAGGVLGVLWLFGAFDDPAPRAAVAAAPVRAATVAPAPVLRMGEQRFEAFSSGPGWQASAGYTIVHGPADIRSEWRRGRGGLELCTTIAGQTRCTPVGR